MNPSGNPYQPAAPHPAEVGEGKDAHEQVAILRAALKAYVNTDEFTNAIERQAIHALKITRPKATTAVPVPASTDEAIAGENDKGIAHELCLPICTPDWVKSLRIRYNMTQSEFAASVGVRQATVSDWENGNQSVSRLAAIALSFIDQRSRSTSPEQEREDKS